MQPTISLIIPTYNPPNGWEKVFGIRYHQFCAAIGREIPVILVNDGSQADMRDGVTHLQNSIGPAFHYVHYEKNVGKGGALKKGASHLDSDLYMFTDIDFPYSTDSMKNVYEVLLSTGGLVAGYRQEAYYADLSLFRTLLSKALRALNNIILNLPTNDTQCGLKAFDKKTRDILLTCKTDRFLIDLELMLAANNRKISIHPTLVTLRDDVEFTKFNSSVLLKEVFNFGLLIWKYRVKKSKS